MSNQNKYTELGHGKGVAYWDGPGDYIASRKDGFGQPLGPNVWVKDTPINRYNINPDGALHRRNVKSVDGLK